MDPPVARKTARTLEPFHGLVYFAAECHAEYAALGLDERDGYFASRSAPMGPVGPAVVKATFFNFSPHLIERAIPAAWDTATPSALLAARLSGIDAALGRTVGGEALSGTDVARAAELARRAAESARCDGRPLAAAHQELPWPDQPHLILWHAISVLREHRGDGHVSGLVAAGVSGPEALVLHAATGEIPAPVLQHSRGWSDSEWADTMNALVARGLLGAGGLLTDAGRTFRQSIEDQTDSLAVQPWSTIGEDACSELRNLVRPWSKSIVASGSFGLTP